MIETELVISAVPRSGLTRSLEIGHGGQEMDVGQFRFHRRAFAALNELSPADQAMTEKTGTQLESTGQKRGRS
jgi:hypothetical protein